MIVEASRNLNCVRCGEKPARVKAAALPDVPLLCRQCAYDAALWLLRGVAVDVIGRDQAYQADLGQLAALKSLSARSDKANPLHGHIVTL